MKNRYYISKKLFGDRKKLNFVSTMAYLSIFGLSIGVASLLIILSVFNGFDKIVTKIMINHDPHVRIELLNSKIENNEIENYLNSQKEIKSKSKYISGKILLNKNLINRVIELKGFEQKYLSELINLEANKNLDKKIILGISLQNQTGIDDGDSIKLISPNKLQETLLNPFYSPDFANYFVDGSFRSSNKEYDQNFAYTTIENATNIFEKKQNAGWEIKFYDIKQTEEFILKLKSKNFANVRILTWKEIHKTLFSMMQIEKWIATILILFITIVSIVSLYASISMLIKQKIRDIGTLESIGLTKKEITSIFKLIGLKISAIGISLGIILSVSIILLQQKYHLFPLDETVYIIPAIPTEMQLTDFIFVSLVSIVLSYLAIIISTRMIYKLSPATLLRWE